MDSEDDEADELAAAVVAFEASSDDAQAPAVAAEADTGAAPDWAAGGEDTSAAILPAPVDLLATLVQDREATVLSAMEEEPIDHADLESAVAGAGRFSYQLSPTLDAANGRLITWRRNALRAMWEFADAAYFFRCFHTDELLVSLPKCDVSDLERLLLDTSSHGLAGTLHIALMKLVWPRLPATDENWFKLLLSNFSAIEGLVEGSWGGTLETMMINEEEDGKVATDIPPPSHSNQTIHTKMMLLHALIHLVVDVEQTGVMAVIRENPDSWKMQPDCWYEDDMTKIRHEFYYFTGESTEGPTPTN